MTSENKELEQIGEFELIRRISSVLDIIPDDPPLFTNLIKGISDDAAVFRPSPEKVQLFTTDAFVEGIHFDLTFTSLKHLGWKAMIANISDIIAMNGIPRYATIAISIPNKIFPHMVEELYQGAANACRKYSCLIVGGDTTASIGGLIISVALIGETEEQNVRYRNGAKPGELICVTGHLGSSIAGLKILEREKKKYEASPDKSNFKPALEPYKLALEKHLMPKARLDMVQIFKKNINIGALIDISDGLASELHHICEESNVGAKIYEHNIPIETITGIIAQEFLEQPTDYALYGGEEYELLFTISDKEYEKIATLTDDVTIIGRVTEKDVILVQENGEESPLPWGGYDHFKSKRISK